MPGRARAEKRSEIRWRRQRVWAASILVAGILLFAWPFVRTPPLGLGQTYLHLLGAWALVIAALAAMSRSLGGGGGEGGGG